MEEVAKGNLEYFITGRVHVAHCVVSWLYFQKALSEGRKVASQNNMGHTWRCSNVLQQDRKDPDEAEIRVKVAFPGCGYMSCGNVSAAVELVAVSGHVISRIEATHVMEDSMDPVLFLPWHACLICYG